MRLMIAVPCLDMIRWEFARSLTALVCRLKDIGVQVDVVFRGGTLVYVARELLASDAINGAYDRVLWLDADMVFEPDLYERLASAGAPMATALYRSRRPPYKLTIFRTLAPPVRMERLPEDRVFDVAACGFGGVLMDVDVLRRVKAAYTTTFTPMEYLGEDMAFCARVLDAKISRIVAVADARMGHIGYVTLTPDWCPE